MITDKLRICLIALVLLTQGALSGCGVIARQLQGVAEGISSSQAFRQGRHGPLTEKELQWAQTAWAYFVNNHNPETGLVNSVDQYPSTTMWHVADYVAALVAAYELGFIDMLEFDQKFSRLLSFLNTMHLINNSLPNKAYHTKTGEMVDYSNKPGAIGWSAIDIGRLVIWLQIARSRYPQYSEYIDKAIVRWRFCDIIDKCGTLYGGVSTKGNIDFYQEGRLGYEEYAA
ncbi:MAG: DUF3131 domain-containing protein, partial [Pseudomonadota bacterium]